MAARRRVPVVPLPRHGKLFRPRGKCATSKSINARRVIRYNGDPLPTDKVQEGNLSSGPDAYELVCFHHNFEGLAVDFLASTEYLRVDGVSNETYALETARHSRYVLFDRVGSQRP